MNLLLQYRPAKARPRARGRLSLLAALLALGALVGGTAHAADLTLSRNLYAGQDARPGRSLAPGPPVTVVDEVWSVEGVTGLRVRSPDPEVAAVFRFVPLPPEQAPTDAGARFRLTVILLSREGLQTYPVKSGSQRMTAEGLQPRRGYRIGDGLTTLLEGPPGRVTELVVQDDAEVEVRIAREGEELVLEAVPPRQGGVPSRPGPAWYEGMPLTFADYVLLLGGYLDHGYGDLWLFRTVSLRVNVFVADDATTTLGRGVITQQAWRSERLSLWAEGGVAFYAVTPATGTAPDPEVTYTGGVTLHWRYADWGAALQAALVGQDETVMAVFGNWQLSETWSLLAFWHAFGDGAELGLGAGVNF